MAEDDPTHLSRRTVLTLGASLALAGCTAMKSSSREQWNQQDAFPNDGNRNRECTIRDLDSGSGTIDRMPFAYSIDGRADLHGTNQHVNVQLTANTPLDVFISDQKNAAIAFLDLHQAGKEPGDNEAEDIFRSLSSYSQKHTQSYEQLITIPDNSTYTIVVAPADRELGTGGVAPGPIPVRYSFDCSYFLSFDEYEKLSGSDN